MLTEQSLILASTCSRYFAWLLEQPGFRSIFLKNGDYPLGEDFFSDWLTRINKKDEFMVMQELRRLRKTVLGHLVLRDINGLADLDEVMHTMTFLAETALQIAVQCASIQLSERYGDPIGHESQSSQTLIVVGMGKLGGRELNVSSDIDLIFTYPEEGETNGEKTISCKEFFSLVAKKVIYLLSEITEEGFVFRVDMRLRPYGHSGSLCSGFASLETYYQSQGREWERYALIKARVVYGERAHELMALLQPFVFRKYLDFGAFASMRNLYEQIQQEVLRRDQADNIKTGPGGIRQIEFCAQVFQLVRGGRVPELRKKATLDVLHEIALLGYLPASVIHCLCTSYVFLRRLEHRLQYLDDAQTHRLPSDVNDCLLIAQGMGFENVTPFLVKLNEVREEVKNHFNALFIQQKYTVEHDSGYLGFLALDKAEMEKRFHDLGFIEAEKWVDRLCEWRESTRYRQLSESAQNRLMGLMPRLLKAASEYSNPDDTLGRILDLIEVLGRREAYFALLDEYPFSLGQVAQICSASQWAADFLAQHPLLLDELLDERLLRALPEVSELRTVLKKKLETADDELELQLDCFAQTKNSHVFHLLAQDLAGLVSIETLGDHLSDLADMILDEMLNFCWQKLLRKPWEDRHFAVIAYGRLGGRELGYASDLDLVFLYEDGRDEAAMIYARLAQRMNAYLTSTGREGSLYEIDLRLRPNGASGLLVSSFMAYEHYLMDEAWVWELQALSRARFVAGDRSIGLEFEQLRRKVLAQPRDLSQLRASVVSMRKKMLKNHANSDDTFDIKHDKGGMVDIEFIVQFLVLGYSHDYPGLLDNAGNIALLQRAAQVNLVTHEEAQAICGVYRDFRSRQHKVKLQGNRYSRVADKKWSRPRREKVIHLWNRLFC